MGSRFPNTRPAGQAMPGKNDSSSSTHKRSRFLAATGINTRLSIPDELLELILLGVESPVDLIHAASVCKRWRSIIANASFLRRFRSAHEPIVARKYLNSYRPSDKPRPLPFLPLPTMIADSHHFSLDFLPDSHVGRRFWYIIDSRGSLLLLEREMGKRGPASDNDLEDIVVCEPLTRRYVKFSPGTTFQGDRTFISQIHLADGDVGIGITDFKVLCLLHSSNWDGTQRQHECYYVVGVLSSNGSKSKRKIHGTCLITIGEPTDASVYCYTGGREVIAIDRRSTEVSTLMLPDTDDWEKHIDNVYATGGCADGDDRIVFPTDNGTIKVFVRSGGGCELKLDKIIKLSEVTRSLPYWHKLFQNFRRGRANICFGLRRTPQIVVSRQHLEWFRFCLNVETQEVVDVSDCRCEVEYPCEFPWPPVLCARTTDGHFP